MGPPPYKEGTHKGSGGETPTGRQTQNGGTQKPFGEEVTKGTFHTVTGFKPA